MLQLPSITPEGKLECSIHHKPLEKITWKCKQTKTNGKFLCEECPLELGKIRQFKYQVYPEKKAYAISFLDLPPISSNDNITETQQVKIPIDFRSCQVEHIIIDEDSVGYSAKNIVYIPENQVLIACSSNGTMLVWSTANGLNLRGRFDVGKSVSFGEYIDRGEKGKHLMLGVENEIYVYNVKDDMPVYLTALNCETNVNDIDYIPSKDQIVSVGDDKFVRVWNLKDWSIERTINTKSSRVKLPMISVVYIERKNALAIEDKEGVYIINLEKKKNETLKFYRIEDRKMYGLGYLPQHQELVLRSSYKGVHMLDDEDLSVKKKYSIYMNSLEVKDSRLLINEDETQILSSTPPGRIAVYHRDGTHWISLLTGMIEKGPVLELMRDQYRFIIADKECGLLFILRTNVPKDTGFTLQGSVFEKDKKKLDHAGMTEIAKAEPMILENAKYTDKLLANEAQEKVAEEEKVEERREKSRSKERKGKKGSKRG